MYGYSDLAAVLIHRKIEFDGRPIGLWPGAFWQYLRGNAYERRIRLALFRLNIDHVVILIFGRLSQELLKLTTAFGAHLALQLRESFFDRPRLLHRMLDVGLYPNDARQQCVVLNVPINELMAILVECFLAVKLPVVLQVGYIASRQSSDGAGTPKDQRICTTPQRK